MSYSYLCLFVYDILLFHCIVLYRCGYVYCVMVCAAKYDVMYCLVMLCVVVLCAGLSVLTRIVLSVIVGVLLYLCICVFVCWFGKVCVL